MPKKIAALVTKEDAERIHRRRNRGATWADIRNEFGLGMSTAKRALERHGFDHSPAAATRPATEKWSRPCLKCGSTELRTKGLFRCKACRHKGRTFYNAGDSMYSGFNIGG